MHIVGSTLTIAILLGAAAIQGSQQSPPPVPADLVALARVPMLDVRVADTDGRVPGPRVYVNWRNLTDNLSGGGATDAAGRFTMTPRPQWSATPGWRLGQVGLHRIEVVAEGFKTWVADSVDLQPGQTRRLDVVLERRGATVLLDADTYARLGAEHVLKSMTAKKGDTGQVRVVGSPVLLPEHAQAAGVNPRSMPEAFVNVTVSVNGTFREPAIVSFRDGRPDVRFSYPGPSDFLPLEEDEWQEVAMAVGGFYAVAVDVTRGPERFYEYLPDDMRQMLDLRGEKNRLFLTQESVRTLSNAQLREFVALYLDVQAITAWLALYKLPQPGAVGRPADIRRDPVGVIASLQSAMQEARRTLDSAGVLKAERMAGSQIYVRRLLGEGYMVREAPGRDGIRNLPRGARMYTVALGGPLPHVTLAKGRLRIVAVDLY